MKNSLAQNRKTAGLERALHQKPGGNHGAYKPRKAVLVRGIETGRDIWRNDSSTSTMPRIFHIGCKEIHTYTHQSQTVKIQRQREARENREKLLITYRESRIRLIDGVLSEIIGVRKHQKDIFKLPKEKYLSTGCFCFVLFLIWQNYLSQRKGKLRYFLKIHYIK